MFCEQTGSRYPTQNRRNWHQNSHVRGACIMNHISGNIFWLRMKTRNMTQHDTLQIRHTLRRKYKDIQGSFRPCIEIETSDGDGALTWGICSPVWRFSRGRDQDPEHSQLSMCIQDRDYGLLISCTNSALPSPGIYTSQVLGLGLGLGPYHTRVYTLLKYYT